MEKLLDKCIAPDTLGGIKIKKKLKTYYYFIVKNNKKYFFL